jgi:hypothetical protein
MILNKQLVEFNGELYWVYRKVRVEQVSNPNSLKDFWMCDITLKQQDWLWFCRHIPQALIES